MLLHNKPILFGLFAGITVLGLMLWRRAGWIAKSLLAPAMGISLIAAASAWLNPYEQMFHPFGAPRYITIQEAASILTTW